MSVILTVLLRIQGNITNIICCRTGCHAHSFTSVKHS